MISCKKFLNCVFLLLSFCVSIEALASSALSSQQFIDMALVRSISEIETAKIALEKSSSAEVKAYAQVVIEEQANLLDSLRKLAREQHLNILNDSELQVAARVFIFQRKGKTFDAAYAEMRVTERKKAVGLFRAAAMLDDKSIKQYAARELPILMRHLYMANTLIGQVGSGAVLIAHNP